MKAHVRVLGLDDAPFRFGDARVPVVGVVVRVPDYVEAVMTTTVAVDGTDATDVVSAKLASSRHREGLALVLLDGIALGGFNVIDLDRLHEVSGVPIATVTRKRPDLQSMERALRGRFADWRERAALVRRHRLWTLTTEHRPLYGTAVGMDREDLTAILRRSTVRGAIPEPLRLAHLIATAIVKGESRGRP